ncbi:MAG: hypothetical protein QG604_528 [Candidatus Dependentiae bacterium]|nr:hypothetical protein [Candidatus Dependentiae bacterium]
MSTIGLGAATGGLFLGTLYSGYRTAATAERRAAFKRLIALHRDASQNRLQDPETYNAFMRSGKTAGLALLTLIFAQLMRKNTTTAPLPASAPAPILKITITQSAVIPKPTPEPLKSPVAVIATKQLAPPIVTGIIPPVPVALEPIIPAKPTTTDTDPKTPPRQLAPSPEELGEHVTPAIDSTSPPLRPMTPLKEPDITEDIAFTPLAPIDAPILSPQKTDRSRASFQVTPRTPLDAFKELMKSPAMTNMSFSSHKSNTRALFDNQTTPVPSPDAELLTPSPPSSLRAPQTPPKSPLPHPIFAASDEASDAVPAQDDAPKTPESPAATGSTSSDGNIAFNFYRAGKLLNNESGKYNEIMLRILAPAQERLAREIPSTVGTISLEIPADLKAEGYALDVVVSQSETQSKIEESEEPIPISMNTPQERFSSASGSFFILVTDARGTGLDKKSGMYRTIMRAVDPDLKKMNLLTLKPGHRYALPVECAGCLCYIGRFS